MNQSKSHGVLFNWGRVFVFGLSVAFSLGWLIAPDAIKVARDRVAGYVHLGPERVDRSPTAGPSTTVAPLALGPSALRWSSAIAPDGAEPALRTP